MGSHQRLSTSEKLTNGTSEMIKKEKMECEARARRPVNYSINQHYSSHVGIYSVIVARIFMTRDTPTYSRDGRRGGRVSSRRGEALTPHNHL